jgi:uncharacterized RDD family membrane protein YckC
MARVLAAASDNPIRVDRDIDVRTPESIAFNYELAGLGSRFLALAIDQVIQIVVLVALLYAVVVLGLRALLVHAIPLSGQAEKVAAALVIAVVVLVTFTIFFGYFIIFEILWNGQTPGKRALGIRVVRDGGYPVDFGASVIRNLIRIGELAFGYYALSAASMLLSPENKRLGDYAAGTIVVRESSIALGLREGSANAAPAYAPTLYLSGEERALVKRFIERRDALTPETRGALASRLAARIRDRVPPELHALDDEALLERL